jgi:hypothetical protein
MANLGLNVHSDLLGSCREHLVIKRGKFLSDDPEGHGVNISTDNVETQAVRLQKRSTTSHERIRNDAL